MTSSLGIPAKRFWPSTIFSKPYGETNERKFWGEEGQWSPSLSHITRELTFNLYVLNIHIDVISITIKSALSTVVSSSIMTPTPLPPSRHHPVLPFFPQPFHRAPNSLLCTLKPVDGRLQDALVTPTVTNASPLLAL